MELKNIKTTELIVDKFNVRGDEWDNDEELVDSIRSQGVLEPLLIRPIKSQTSKYPKGKRFSIICGGRRWHASLEARQKTVPCVLRNDIDDVTTLGTSLQENLKRQSLDRIQEAEAIAKMWEMLNGERSYEQKIKEMNKMFGLGERSVRSYIAISRLSDTLKTIVRHQGATDTHILEGISTEDKWSDRDKKEAITELSEIESSKDRRALLSEMKARAEEEKPREALESIKKEMRGLQGIMLNIWLNAKERQATVKAAKKNSVEMETLVKRNHLAWLKKEGFLK